MNASILLVEVPGDAVELRRTDPQRALAWRRALRDVLVPAFADGQAVVGVTRDSHYVLANGPLDDVALPDRLGGQA
jgi:predicted GNAT superfamily acetyltransferase